MSESLNHDRLSDDLFRNRIAAALSELDLPESAAEIAAALDAVDAEPLGDAATRRIMKQVRRSIAGHNSVAKLTGEPEGVSPRTDLDPIVRGLTPTGSPMKWRSQVVVVVACAALVAVGLVIQRFDDVERPQLRQEELLSSKAVPKFTDSVAIQRVQLGETLSSGPRERRRVTLPDGSVLSINEQTRVTISGERRVKLSAGEVFVEVVPTKSSERFVVETPHRTVTALGTKFVVKAQDQATNVVVTQGKVQVSGVEEVIPAGQELIADLTEPKSAELRPAKRSAYVVEWVKDLMASAGSIVVPTSEHAGGTVTVVDPQGQEMKLSLRKFHVDVHIEEGFARTTIDQTYFNHTWQQLEGTFRFPLPADASLSRLAMYVNGKLMEGGMVERDYGRNVFEQIRHTRRDPALLEWVDGSTFQMRVFPLEPRQEKRLLLSYTQRLPSDYGKSVYRFPAGHNLDGVREWSAHLRVKGEAGAKWYSPSHLLDGRDEQGDLVLDGREEHAVLDRDLVIEFGEEKKPSGEPEGVSPRTDKRAIDRVRGLTPSGSPRSSMWSVCEQDGFQYVMLRYRPELQAISQRSSRQWIFLVENSADRNDLLAETQRQIVNVLLENAEHSDTFSIIRAGTQADAFRRKPVPCSLENVAAAHEFLREVAPIGALDLEQALQSVRNQVRGKQEVWIAHLGTGIPVLGERDETTLLRLLPPKARYVGIAVGKRWSKSFMETAANHSGGHVTQINPDEAVAWRAFDLLSTLNAPRLTEIKVAITAPRDEPSGTNAESRQEAIREPNDKGSSRGAMTATEPEWLLLTNSLAHGQELAAVARFPKNQPLPKSILITGKLDGELKQSLLEVPNGSHCGHLPRTWARLEIDRLVALGATEHKPQIIELSKSMYVMSPFTSLLVLETEEMYAQFQVDRGRKDHWAMYPAPAEIPVVVDQGSPQLSPLDAAKERLKLTQARAKSAQSNYERSVNEKRPAADLQRLDRLSRAEQAEVKLIEREIQRIERANVAADDPLRQAWDSVVQRRTAWQLLYGPAQHHWNYWGKKVWEDANGNGLFELSEDIGGNGNLNVYRWMASPNVWSDGGRHMGYFSLQTPQGLLNFNAAGNLNRLSFEAVNGRWDVRDSVLGLAPFEVYGNGADTSLSLWIRQSQSLARPSLVEFDDLSEVREGRWRTYASHPRIKGFDNRYLAPLIDSPFSLNDFSELSGERDRRVRVLSSVRDEWLGANPINDFDFTYRDWNSSLFGEPRDTSTLFGRHGIDVALREFHSDLDSDGIRDPIWVDFEPTVLATENLPSVLWQQSRAAGSRGFFDTTSIDTAYTDPVFTMPLPHRVTNGKYIPLTAFNVFDGWHPAFGRYPVVAGHDRLLTRYYPVGDLVIDPNPVFAPHPLAGVLKDLPSYAPGLQTWPADRLAIVEQAAATKPQRGEVDAEARRLIEKARSLGWEKVRLTFNRNAIGVRGDGQPTRTRADGVGVKHANYFTIAAGSGRFVFEREVGEGLKETVIHDGRTLWHLYPEIGLGAKRTLSRFHQSAIQSLIPWYVPSADDLSVDADVKTIGERTVRITLTKGDVPVAELVRVRTADEPNRSLTNSATVAPHQIAFELVFAEDGRLSESRVIGIRRLGLRPDQSNADVTNTVGTESQPTILAKQTFAADGTIRLFDAEDKLIGEAKYERQPIEAPNLVPATKDLVVLPLPYRSAAGVPVSVPVNLQTNEPDFAKLSEDDALMLLATYFAEARGDELEKLIRLRYSDKGDHRIGFAVLMSSVKSQVAVAMSARTKHLDEPLAKFLEPFAHFAAQGNLSGSFDVGPSASPFLQRVCSAYNQYCGWATDRIAARERPAADVQRDLEATLVFIRDCRSVDLAATLLTTVDLGLKRTERMNATFARLLNDATAAMSDERGIPAFGRTARIEWLLTVGDETSVTQAKELFRSQLADAVTLGGIPELNGDTRTAFVKHFKTPDGQSCEPWSELVKEAAQKLSRNALASGSNDARKPDASAFRLIAMARACASMREWTVAAAIFQLAIQGQDLSQQPRLNLAAFGYAKQVGDWEQAEACIQRALADEKLAKNSQLWRNAAETANQRRHFKDWIERLDHAYELEFTALPKTVNLEAFRKDYESLFGQLEQRAEQLADAKQSEKFSFGRMVQRAAARWRDIDVDDTAACHRTATILAKLGLATAAWNYWTTPLAETPDRSAVWQTFAAAMHSQQRLVVADRAWSTAFACEPTNPEILLQHAQFLRSTHQEHKARELLTKITTNTWQPRFENTKQQAQQLLTGGGSPK